MLFLISGVALIPVIFIAFLAGWLFLTNRIYPNVEICQIFYHSVEGAVVNYVSGKYQANREVQTSRLWMDFQK